MSQKLRKRNRSKPLLLDPFFTIDALKLAVEQRKNLNLRQM
jgi:hypothetical protein